MVKVVGIRFRNAGKIYYFGPGKLQLKAGMHAIVETARGVEMGTVMTDPREVSEESVVQPLKHLAAVFRTRIELRQIGVRDETKIMGGYGICGRQLCCHTFLSEFAPVSIKMAKEQNLSLNPTKISGVCGRLMCCLKNEEETYEYLNSRLPNVGDYVTTDDGLKGEVSAVNVLRQLVKVLVEVNDEKELREYQADQLKFKPKRRRDVKLTAEEIKELAALEDRGGKSKIDDAK